MDEKNRNPSVTGGSSLLIIFAVLCLVTFAVLGLATVQADKRLMSDMTDAVSYYHQADDQAQRTLAQLRSGVIPHGVASSGVGIYEWRTEMPNGLVLDCRVRVGQDGEYQILRWASVPGKGWNGDFSLPVWTGE